ncbi:unnamed protein product, partial [Medioppia subpectinata]
SAHHYRRNYEQAIHFHEQVLRISQEIGDRMIESKAYAGLGHASRCMGDLLQAKRWHERQLNIGLVTKNRFIEGQACSNLGLVYQLLGDFDGALKLHWSHLTISKQLNDSSGMARAYGNIGTAYSSLKSSHQNKSTADTPLSGGTPSPSSTIASRPHNKPLHTVGTYSV